MISTTSNAVMPKTTSKNGIDQTQVLSGADVIAFLEQPGTREQWDELYRNCEWSTAFQSFEYANTWYRNYQDEYLPVLVVARSGNRLSGVLTMAIKQWHKNSGEAVLSKRIIGAGHYESAYQIWLATAENQDSFILDSIKLLQRSFPGASILFRYFPQNARLDWINRDPKLRKRIVLQPYTRPVVDLNHASVAKMLKNSHFRNKLNRLKRLGEMSFVRINTVEEFAGIIDEMTTMFDFRQGALYNKNQFRNEPIRKKELLEEMEQGLVHLTVLKVGDRIISGLACRADNEWVHLGGIICQSPYNSRFFSPGLLHYTLLFKMLQEEGYKYFDLTPGYEAYKEQFANMHDTVHECVIAGDSTFLVKRRMRKLFHDSMVKMGLRPLTIELNIKKKLYFLKNHGVARTIKNTLAPSRKDKPAEHFMLPAQVLEVVQGGLFLRDNLNALLNFDDRKTPGLTRWEFLAEANNRFEGEEHCFTIEENDRLIFCGWVKDQYLAPLAGAEVPKDRAPVTMLVLEGIYCHSGQLDRLPEYLAKLAATVSVDKTLPVYISVKQTSYTEILLKLGYIRANPNLG